MNHRLFLWNEEYGSDEQLLRALLLLVGTRGHIGVAHLVFYWSVEAVSIEPCSYDLLISLL